MLLIPLVRKLFVFLPIRTQCMEDQLLCTLYFIRTLEWNSILHKNKNSVRTCQALDEKLEEKEMCLVIFSRKQPKHI